MLWVVWIASAASVIAAIAASRWTGSARPQPAVVDDDLRRRPHRDT